MKHYLIFILGLQLVLLVNCEQTAKLNYQPSQYFDTEGQDSILKEIIHFVAPMPKKADHQTKFDSIFDEHYQLQQKFHQIIAIYHSPKVEDQFYLLIKRPASSIYEKYVGIGIILELNEQKQLSVYEEKFRTWKMDDANLQKKGMLLFDLMVHGKDLKPYYTKNSKGEEYIEFPDDETHFDKVERKWISTRNSAYDMYMEGN
ncbi:MAG: hypothetical protein IPO62_05380 [Saprospiraceae bacterium]|nr:hypothetical protein [Saprospiraceae bacterium]